MMRKLFVAVNKNGSAENRSASLLPCYRTEMVRYRTAEKRSASSLPYRNGTGYC
jgi:hypothetical protein